MQIAPSMKSHKAFKAFENFKLKSKEKYGNLYDYSKVLYKGNKKTVTIICPIHGEFNQFPGNHLLGGCKECGQETRRKPQETFVEESNAIHKNKYSYIKTNYINAKTNITIVCHIHGEFEQTPDSHLRGCGCPECASINIRKKYFNEPTILYHIYFPKHKLYKIGITMERVGIKKRYSTEYEEFEVLEEILFTNGKEAYLKEQELLNKYKDYIYKGPKIFIKGGDTELLIKNIALTADIAMQ